MRIQRIRLVRFGEYADREVGDLGPGLNILHGGNETGKSTLLGALRFALFGSDFRDYSPPDNTTREVELLLLRDGRAWALVRREGRGRPAFQLSAQDNGEGIAIATFRQEWLGGTTLAAFRSVYALGLDELAWDSEIRGLLLIAESGSAGRRLGHAIDATNEAANNLFALRAQRLLNQALQRWREAHDDVRKYSHRPSKLEEKERQLAEEETAAQELAQAIERLRQRQSQTQSLADARPQWEQVCALRLQVGELAYAGNFSPSPKEDYDQAKERQKAAESQETQARQKREQAQEQLSQVHVNERVLELAGDIERLARDAERISGKPSQLRDAEQKRETAIESAKREARERCGRQVTCEAVQNVDVSGTALSELDRQARALDEAANRERQAEENVRKSSQELAEAQKAVEQAEERLSKLPRAVDLKPLQESKVAANRLVELKRQEGVLSERLAGAESSLNDLRVRREREEKARQEAEDRARELAAQQRATQEQASLRSRRAAKTALLITGAAMTVVGVLLLSFGQTIGGVVLVAGGLVVIVVGATQTVAQVTIPSLAFPVITTVTDEDVEKAQEHRQSCAAELEEHRTKLLSQGTALGLPEGATLEDTQQLIGQLERQIVEAHANMVNRGEAQAKLEEAKGRFDRATSEARVNEEQMSEAAAAAERAKGNWDEWLASIGLPPSLAAEGARAYLDGARSVQQRLGEAGDAARIAGQLRQDLHAFCEWVAAVEGALCRAHGADDLWGIESARSFGKELQRQQELDRKRKQWEERIKEATEEEESHKRQREEAAQAMADALERAGAQNEDDLIRRAQNFQQLTELNSRLREAQAGLRGSPTAQEWEVWQQRLSDADWTAVQADMTQLQEQLDDANTQLMESRERIGGLRGDIQRLQTETALADAQRRQEESAARVRELAREWVAQAATHSLLDLTRRRFERDRQPETIRRTAELFGRVTDSRWPVLLTREDTVVAVGGEDGAVEREPGKLSRSTKESLFLCARLAAIERSISRCPLPVALDDALVNLDPERLSFALQVVAELSRDTQVLLFTCHPHLIQQIRNAGIEPRVVEL